MALKIVSPPTSEPLTIEECREHLNVQPYDIDSDGLGTHPHDRLIMAMQSAARAYCENFLGISIARKTYELALDQFPSGPIDIPMAPPLIIESVNVGEGSDSLVDSETYTLDDFSVPVRLVPVTSWPSTAASTNQIRIRFVAGFGGDSDGEPLPWEIRAAILLLLGSLYAYREDAAEKPLVSIPTGVEALLRPLRIRMGMA